MLYTLDLHTVIYQILIVGKKNKHESLSPKIEKITSKNFISVL